MPVATFFGLRSTFVRKLRVFAVRAAAGIYVSLRLSAAGTDLSPVQATAVAFVTETAGGRTVWRPTNRYLGFQIPKNFAPNTRVTIEVEYLDAGSGRLFAEYDTHGTLPNDIYRDAEVHTRSSRIDTGTFVKSYQVFEVPVLTRRQAGACDFRLTLLEGDATPLQVAAVRITAGLFDDERLHYAASRPWLGGYNGPTLDTFPNTSLDQKIMVGYQGWYRTPNDWDDRGWAHWTRSTTNPPNTSQLPSSSNLTVDQWPDLTELSPASRYRAGNLLTKSGKPAELFSSTDKETVRNHFRWMRLHGIDGAYLQRFVTKRSLAVNGGTEFVLHHVREAANLEGRIWAIEYDISSLDTDYSADRSERYDTIVADWKWLVDETKLLRDPRYARHGGKPVVFIWGFSVPDRDFTAAEANRIVNFFKRDPVYGGNHVIGGGPNTWRTQTEASGWPEHYRLYDEFLAWQQRGSTALTADKDRLAAWGITQVPHVWPGFSWHNLKFYAPFRQYTDRAGGQFYWDRIYEALRLGTSRLFVGMFDEYDEGTAIMPMSDDPPEPFGAYGFFETNKGRPGDWWLQLTKAAKEVMLGTRALSPSLPSPESLPPDRVALGTPPTIVAQPKPQAITAGGNGLVSVFAASATPFTYQWYRDGTSLPGATGASLLLPNARATAAGSYRVVITNSAGRTESAAVELDVFGLGRLSNLSVLTTLDATSPRFIAGTVIGGAGTSGNKPLLIRAAGPSLAPLGVPAVLADPKLEIYSGASATAANDNWGGTAALITAFNAVGAFPFAASGSRDAAVFQPAMPPGGHTVEISGVDGATGAVILELYDSTPSSQLTARTPRLVNVSVLKQINAGEKLIAGFTLGGVVPTQVLVRAVGPTLGTAPFNLGGVMTDPTVELFTGQTATAGNDQWETPSGVGAATAAQLSRAFQQVGAFALPPGSKDAALLATLPPGSYTAQVGGSGGAGGIAIVEIYEVP